MFFLNSLSFFIILLTWLQDKKWLDAMKNTVEHEMHDVLRQESSKAILVPQTFRSQKKIQLTLLFHFSRGD